MLTDGISLSSPKHRVYLGINFSSSIKSLMKKETFEPKKLVDEKPEEVKKAKDENNEVFVTRSIEFYFNSTEVSSTDIERS